MISDAGRPKTAKKACPASSYYTCTCFWRFQLAAGVFALTRFVLNRQPISSASASSSTAKTTSEDPAQPISSPASGTLAQAAYIAAGYDYDRAIALIKEDSLSWQKTPLPWKRSHLMRKQRLLSYQLMCRTFPMYFSILLSWTLPKPLTATAGLPATIPS